MVGEVFSRLGQIGRLVGPFCFLFLLTAGATAQEGNPARDAAITKEIQEEPFLAVNPSTKEFAIAKRKTLSSDELEKEVEAAIKEFSNNSYAQRFRAERRVLELGADVIPILEKLPENDLRPEARLHIRRILEQLRESAFKTDIRPSLVTLEGTMMVSELFDEIELQTQNKIDPSEIRWGDEDILGKTLSVNYQKLTFWEVFDQLLDESSADIYSYSSHEEGLRIIQRLPDRRLRYGSASYDGAFRIAPVSASVHSTFLAETESQVHLELEVMWEPRLRPLSLTLTGDTLVATTEYDTPVEIDEGESHSETPLSIGEFSSSFSIHFPKPHPSVKKISKLRGIVQAHIPSRFKRFSFEQLKSKQTQTADETTVTFTTTKKENDEMTSIYFQVQFESPSTDSPLFYGWLEHIEPTLVHKETGEVLKPYGYVDRNSVESRTFEFQCPFEVSAEDLKNYVFIASVPSDITCHEIPFMLKDIILP
ncbi:MAG: hypothetical protein MPJ24_07685 [Pirellulaceae bacterium]|nr:hypothetical protein [Pirellulaceae bacterium]